MLGIRRIIDERCFVSVRNDLRRIARDGLGIFFNSKASADKCDEKEQRKVNSHRQKGLIEFVPE
jgi:hypothetical protein